MSPKSEISEGQSKELCDRMNSHQSAFVYALALDHVRSSRGKMKSKVSFVKMNNISIDSYTLSYVECQSDSMCMMVSAKIEIDPPLDSVLDAGPRLLKESHKAMSARYSWMFTETLPLLILSIMMLFGYVSFILQLDGLQSTLNEVPFASTLVESIFGNVDSFYLAVKRSWYLAVFLHVAEAFYVVFKLRSKFNLPGVFLIKWFALVSFVGYPITIRAMEFINVDDEQNSKTKKQS